MKSEDLKASIESYGITVHRDMYTPADVIDGDVRLAKSMKWNNTVEELIDYLNKNGFNNFAYFKSDAYLCVEPHTQKPMTEYKISFAAWNSSEPV